MTRTRRNLRYLLRAAIVLVVVACPLSYLYAVLSQRFVVAEIAAVHGSVIYEREYDYHAKWESIVCETGEEIPWDPPAPSIIERILGPDIALVSCVDLRRYRSARDGVVGWPVNDEVIQRVSTLRGLRQLDLTFQPITDAGLKHIRAMPRLESLGLYGTQITDQSIRTLSSLPALSQLQIGATRITKQGINELVRLPQLGCLSLSQAQLDEIGGPDAARAMFESGGAKIVVEEFTPTGGSSFSSLPPSSLLPETRQAEPGVGADSR